MAAAAEAGESSNVLLATQGTDAGVKAGVTAVVGAAGAACTGVQSLNMNISRVTFLCPLAADVGVAVAVSPDHVRSSSQASSSRVSSSRASPLQTTSPPPPRPGFPGSTLDGPPLQLLQLLQPLQPLSPAVAMTASTSGPLWPPHQAGPPRHPCTASPGGSSWHCGWRAPVASGARAGARAGLVGTPGAPHRSHGPLIARNRYAVNPKNPNSPCQPLQ